MFAAIARLARFLPQTATAPFCPSEVRGTVDIRPGLPFHRRLMLYVGPGLLVSVGYMDPGNWATDIEGGAKFGFAMLWVVVLASLMAIVLQLMAMRLGIATRQDLAQHCRARYSPGVRRGLWILAELAIIACDLAEVLGTALAFHLLLGVSLTNGILLTAFDTLIVLGLKGKGFRQVEAIMLGLVGTIAVCFLVEMILVQPPMRALLGGLVPQPREMVKPEFWYLAVGVIGATVMPHNLYLHSSIVQTRIVRNDDASKRDAIRLLRWDTIGSLLIALLINAAIMVLAATAFHASGNTQVADIQDAFHLLDPLVGSNFAALLFGIALLAAGQSSTFTGTIAAQVLMEGFLQLKMPCWKRRFITRFCALVPALIGVVWFGDAALGQLLVASQVVLSLQLPFAIWPLVSITSDRTRMGPFANTPLVRRTAWTIFGMVCAANLYVLWTLLA
ncbi:Nramp family divalent metal transporter [Variovorax sp. GT1P44]|uniref:Nramp family divalent metal transporter n=1 Tax=Variovorax sp. GT1P44 TaxID=3443742 RepID=UPI003F48B040